MDCDMTPSEPRKAYVAQIGTATDPKPFAVSGPGTFPHFALLRFEDREDAQKLADLVNGTWGKLH